MSCNITVVVMNDALGHIEEDPEFGKKLVQAILGFGDPEKGQNSDVSAKRMSGTVHPKAATVIGAHGNEDVVTGERRRDPMSADFADNETHACFACGRKHTGLSFENKYCSTCGEAAQERRTLYDAIHCIDIALRGVEGNNAKEARDLAIEALIVAPHGERMGVLDWQAVYEGEITINEAYDKLLKEDIKLKRKGSPRRCNEQEEEA